MEVAKDILAQKKADHAARSKGFIWAEVDDDGECDQGVEADSSSAKSGKQSLAKEMCKKNGEVRNKDLTSF